MTSQRIVDVVLKAFHAAAASQGCTKQVLAARDVSLLTNLYNIAISRSVLAEKTRMAIV